MITEWYIGIPVLSYTYYHTLNYIISDKLNKIDQKTLLNLLVLISAIWKIKDMTKNDSKSTFVNFLNFWNWVNIPSFMVYSNCDTANTIFDYEIMTWDDHNFMIQNCINYVAVLMYHNTWNIDSILKIQKADVCTFAENNGHILCWSYCGY